MTFGSHNFKTILSNKLLCFADNSYNLQHLNHLNITTFFKTEFKGTLFIEFTFFWDTQDGIIFIRLLASNMQYMCVVCILLPKHAMPNYKSQTRVKLQLGLNIFYTKPMVSTMSYECVSSKTSNVMPKPEGLHPMKIMHTIQLYLFQNAHIHINILTNKEKTVSAESCFL